MKRNQDRILPKRRASAAARQGKTVLLFLRRRSLPGARVRLQFVKAETGRVMFSSIFERELLTMLEHAAEKDGKGLGEFIIKAIVWALSRLEAETAQRQEVTA